MYLILRIFFSCRELFLFWCMYCISELSSAVFITLKHIKARTSRGEEDNIAFLSTLRSNLDRFFHACNRGSRNEGFMTCLKKYRFCFADSHTLSAVFSQSIHESVKCVSFIFSSCYEMDFVRSKCPKSSIKRLSSRRFTVINPYFAIPSRDLLETMREGWDWRKNRRECFCRNTETQSERSSEKNINYIMITKQLPIWYIYECFWCERQETVVNNEKGGRHNRLYRKMRQLRKKSNCRRRIE